MCPCVRYKSVYIVSAVAAMAVIASRAQTFNTLASFNQINGGSPQYVSLVQGLDGNFYGTTSLFGTYYEGTIFQITPGGTLTTLYNFCAQANCADGSSPYVGLLLGPGGDLYGTTYYGGASNSCLYGCGTIFRITPGGALTILHSFNGTDGADPHSPLVRGTDGNFYGMTATGANTFGTVFKITPGGTLATLHIFDSTGAYPTAGLVQATDGNFYGITTGGGASVYGTIFKMTPAGALTTLHTFKGADGGNSTSGLVQATDGSLYGTTANFGTYNNGTIFKITLGGTLTTLYSFSGFPDGSHSTAGLVQATDGNFYGTTEGGGANGYGAIFKITPGGTLTILHSFDSTDGANPLGGLVQGTDGNLYGTTSLGGTDDEGAVFSLSVGLGPFVKTLPTSGRVGSAVKILGTNVTGTTGVSFHGKSATFSVVSASEISTTVPDATTGKVQVTTPSGTLTSNVVFRVIPVISSFSPTSGPVGTVVTITGETFTGATSVIFDGVKATSFTVNSNTQITATVPTGAVTGRITVTTPGGKATSAGTFTVN